MGYKRICDKCGNTISEKDTGFSFSKRLHYVSLFGFRDKSFITKHYDLCPECNKEFDKWIESK